MTRKPTSTTTRRTTSRSKTQGSNDSSFIAVVDATAEREEEAVDIVDDGADASPIVDNKQKKKKKTSRVRYTDYWSQDQVDAGLKQGTLLQGKLRINPYNRNEAYVTVSNLKNDIVIEGEVNRNRAFEGDMVAVQVFSQSKWRRRKINFVKNVQQKEESTPEEDEEGIEDSSEVPATEESSIALSDTFMPWLFDQEERSLQPTGQIVAITQCAHRQELVGFLKTCRDNNKITDEDTKAFFVPLDKKFPRMMVNLSECPQEFKAEPTSFAKELFLAKILKWSTNSTFPLAALKTHLGSSGDVEAEATAACVENGIDIKDFNNSIYSSLKKFDSWTIPNSEIANRKDLRMHRVFSIDPQSAKDLDDAVSIQALSNGNFEIGIHIADVSHFIEANSPLDLEAKQRCTSIYLVHKMIPMLPRLLSEDLCSLNPGKDRLAFSVIVTVDKNGQIVQPNSIWFGKTVIHSCAKLDYDLAQQIIDGTSKDEAIPVFSGHSPAALKQDVQMLFAVMSQRRSNRLASGALQLKEDKLKFDLDNNCQPIGICTYETKPSNYMVEELMLLANLLVAEKLVQHMPQHALLRRHVDPYRHKLAEFASICSKHPMTFNATSAGALHASLQIAESKYPSHAKLFYHLARRAMPTARYIISGDVPANQWKHYALHLPCYTHFTSPIRRYADLIVHRMLHQVLQQEQVTESMVAELPSVIERCNEKRTIARNVEDNVKKIFLLAYLSSKPITMDAHVMGISNKSLTLYVPAIGLEHRMYWENCEYEYKKMKKEDKSMNVCWGKSSQTGEELNTSYKLFETIRVLVQIKDDHVNPIKDLLLQIEKPEFAQKTTPYGLCK